MTKAIIIEKQGGPEVLTFSTSKIGMPGKGEVLIRHTAIGVNYIDIYQRNGEYKVDLPFIPGIEACGYVEEIGPEVSGISPGDRVAYGTAKMGGGYAERRIINQIYVVKVPDEIKDEDVAAILTKGMTAHYLLRRAFYIKEDNVILVHAAAGGVGQILTRWAKFLKAKVIATVGSDAKAEIAKKNGADYVINYTTENFASKVMEYTNGKGVNVVYDSVGQATVAGSIASLGYFGLFVSYGNASGKIENFDVSSLAEKSLFMTRPSLFNYKNNRMELILTANDVFDMYKLKVIVPQIHKKFSLKDASLAHAELESRSTTGSLILIP